MWLANCSERTYFFGGVHVKLFEQKRWRMGDVHKCKKKKRSYRTDASWHTINEIRSVLTTDMSLSALEGVKRAFVYL